MTNFELSREHEEFRQSVREFAEAEIAPHAAQWDRDSTFPREALKGLAAMGLYAVAISEELGGAGMGYTELAVACARLLRSAASRYLSIVPMRPP